MTELTATVHRITFTGESDGFAVVRLTTEKGGEQITAVGPLATVVPGARVRLTGSWEDHQRYGRRFRTSSWAQDGPLSTEAVELYLGSGVVPGIGPALAARIVAHFGERTLAVLDKEPDRLALEVSGIGRAKLESIKQSWARAEADRRSLIELQALNIDGVRAARVLAEYGAHAANVVRESPYRLAREGRGIGFATADAIARANGVALDDPGRVEAGIIHRLRELANEGHLYYPAEPLCQEAGKLLSVDRVLLDGALETLTRELFPEAEADTSREAGGSES